MQKYYTSKEDTAGDFVKANHTRYSVTEYDPARVHIPAGREDEMPLYDSQVEFLTSMGLEPVADHTFPEPEPEPVYVPQEVPAWKVHVICDLTPLGEGTLTQAIEAAIAGLTDPIQKAVAAHSFNGNTIMRSSALIESMALEMGLSSEMLDNLFVQANAITA